MDRSFRLGNSSRWALTLALPILLVVSAFSFVGNATASLPAVPVLKVSTIPITSLNPPSKATTYMISQGISCPTTNWCLDVGDYWDASSNGDGYVGVLSNGTWAVNTMPTAGLNPAPGANPHLQPLGVSCPAANSCVMVGSYHDGSGNMWGFSDTLANNTWTLSTMPTTGLSPAASSGTGLEPYGISCPTVTSCVAVGLYKDTANNNNGFSAIMTNGSWSVTTMPTTGLNPSGTLASGSAVSCPSSGSCVAVGDYTDASSNADGFIATLSNGSWTMSTLPTTNFNPASSTSPTVYPDGVSCPTMSSCVVDGYYYDNSGNEYGFVATNASGTWSSSTMSMTGLNPGSNASPFVYPSSISCPTVGTCEATGYYSDTAGNLQGFGASFKNGTWAISTLPTTGLNPAMKTSTYMAPNAVSCPTATACTFTGVYQDSHSYTYAFVTMLQSPPQPPTTVGASVANSKATVSWHAPSDNGGSAITGYSVQYSTNGGATWKTATMCKGTATSCTITGLTAGTSYEFHVSATNAIGTSSYSASSASVTIPKSTTTTTQNSNGNLPNTGSDYAAPLLVAGLLGVSGGALMMATRRRRRRSA